MKSDLYFVYGMLKSGQPKSHMIPSVETRAYRLEGYRMHLIPPRGIAGVVPGNSHDFVNGELKRVEGKWNRLWTKFRVDRNEGHPFVYRRTRVETEHGPAWVYLYRLKVHGCQVIWNWFHGMKY